MVLRPRGRQLAIVVSALVASLVLAACGGGDDDSDSNSSNVGSSADLTAFQEQVDKGFEAASEPQTTKPPTEGPKAQPGKLVVISCAMSAEGCARPSRAAMEAGKAIGWDTTLIDADGDPQKMAAAVTRAQSLGADAIALMAIDSSTIKEPLEQASEAGIYLSCFACVDSAKVYDSLIPPEGDLTKAGYTIGQAAYKLSDGNVQMIQMIDKEFEVLGLRREGTDKFMSECQAAGGDCEVIAQANYLITELSTKVPSITSTVVRQNPDFTVLWGSYDAGMTFMSQGISQAGINTDAFGVSFDANEANLDEIRDGGFQKATIGLPMQWVGYAMVDDLNRLIAGEKTVDQGVQYKLLYADNVPDSGPWDGDFDVRPDYLKVWGK